MEDVKTGKSPYHFIEIMACPGGCIGGGGNPIKDWRKMAKTYGRGLRNRPKFANPKIPKIPSSIWCIESFPVKPNGHKCHELLHTVYTDRSDIAK